MKYSDQQRVEKMRETVEKLLRYVEKENITSERIFEEEAVQWTVTTPLYNIGEHAANLSEDFKKQHPDIPWVKIAGLRHRLVHHYEDTNWTVICAVIFDVLPSFLDELKKLCPTPGPTRGNERTETMEQTGCDLFLFGQKNAAKPYTARAGRLYGGW